ncbi:ATP adenylyltransferase-domain-containing protein [Suillus lakei]|nr:ATP adenylyltransferase-domain-containing protein [Suillus lakei]
MVLFPACDWTILWTLTSAPRLSSKHGSQIAIVVIPVYEDPEIQIDPFTGESGTGATAATIFLSGQYAVWAGLWGIFFRKFFWDFIGGILRAPGGLQPSPKVAVFITVIVKFPVLQAITMALGLIMVTLEYPAPILKGTAIHRSFGLRVVLLTIQASVAVFFYQRLWRGPRKIHPARAGKDNMLTLAIPMFMPATTDGFSPLTNFSLYHAIHLAVDVMEASDIISALPSRFEAAQSSGDLLFFPSEVSKHEEIGIEWEIRLCTALQKKPVAPLPARGAEIAPSSNQSDEAGSKKPDPFAPPYVPNLHIGDLRDESSGAEYGVLSFCRKLRRCCLMIWSKLTCYSLRPEKHPGPQTLKSQVPHAAATRYSNQAHPKQSLGKPFSLSSMPYANHVYRLPSLSNGASPEQLEQVLFLPFLSLLDLVISTVRHAPDYPSGTPSYNVILTLEHMHLIPRRWEIYTLGESGATLSVNSLGFAGMLMVRSESERQALEQEKIGKVLRGVGVESVHELQVAGTSMEAMDETGA